MTLKDTQLDQERSSLLSLLRIVDFETVSTVELLLLVTEDCQLIANPNGPVVNQVILNLVHKVLDSPDYGTIPSELENPTDIQVLLDFILYVRFICFVCSMSLHTPFSYSSTVTCREMRTEKLGV